MSIIEFLSQPLWQRLGLTLVHFLWQGLAIAIFIGACVRVFKLSHGNARYFVYLLAFVAMIVCPVVTFIAIDIPISPNVELFVEIESAEPFDIASDTVPPEGAISPEAGTSIPVMPKLTPVTNTIPIRERIYSCLHNTLPWLLVIWMVGVIVLSMRLLMGFIGVHRWRHHLEPLPERLVQCIASLSEELGMRGFSRVFISPSVLQAMAVGYLRPMVLLPASMVIQMKPEMIEAVIAHELSHIRRFDLWVNLAQRVMETLLFYHPAVWWLSSCLRSERELCCDELAVRVTGERLIYASALESVVQAMLIAKQPVLAAGFSKDNKPVLKRVRHVLAFAPAQRNCSFWIAGVITVLFLTTIAISTMLVPSCKTTIVSPEKPKSKPTDSKSYDEAATNTIPDNIVQRTYNISDLAYLSGEGVFVGDTTGGKTYYKHGSDPGYSGDYVILGEDDGGGMRGHVIIANQTIVNAAQNIVNLIVETIEPDSWHINNNEALGTIFSYPAERPRMLAIHQTPAVQQEIEKLLESLRVPQLQVSIGLCYLYAGEEFFNEIEENMDIEFNLDTFLDDTQVISLLRAFQKNNDAKRLTAPKLTVLNNEIAQYSLRRNFKSSTEYSKPKTVLKSPSPAPINIFCRITPHVKDDNKNVIIDMIQGEIKVPATEITTITNKVIPYGKTFAFPCAISKLDQDDQVTSPQDKKKLIILIKPTIIQPEQAVEAEP